MALASIDDLVAGMAGGALRVPINKPSLASALAGLEMSLWRATGYPAQGAIPTAAAICTDALAGSFPLAARSGGQERAIAFVETMNTLAANALLIEDRLGHMGGLAGNVTTAQTVNLDLDTTSDNIPARIGAADYSEVEWYLEWYSATGSTVTTPTVAVTYHDDTTGTENIWGLAGATALPASVAASRRYRIMATKGIKSVQSVTLSASTGIVGNFGVTAVHRLATVRSFIANTLEQYDWTRLALPLVQDSACMTFGMLCATTSTGAVTGGLTQAVN